MKKKHWIILSIGLVIALGIYVIPGTAQQPAQQPVPFQVAVVDLAQIIRSHPEFNARREALEAELRTAGAAFQQRQEAIEQAQRALNGGPLRVGSPEHQREFDNLAAQVAQLEADFRAQHRRFALRESQIMYETHKNIRDTIGRIAMAGNIAQVTDFRDFEVDPAIPESVAEDMDQRLVWFHPRLDITHSVIQQVYADRQMPIPPAIAERLQQRLPIR